MTHFVLAFAGLATAWAAPACDGDASSPVTASAIALAADAELVGDAASRFQRVAAAPRASLLASRAPSISTSGGTSTART